MVAISMVRAVDGEDGRPDFRLLRLDTAGLAAGAYWLELAFEDPAAPGGERVARSPFQVRS